MNPSDIKEGEFYFHTKHHYVYIGTNQKTLICLESGKQALPPEHPQVRHNSWNHYRPAMKDEINRVLNRNPNYHRNNINTPYKPRGGRYDKENEDLMRKLKK